MFHDLCISPRSTKEQDRELLVRRAIELGYSAIAWNTSVTTKTIQNVKAPQPVLLSEKLFRETALQRGMTGAKQVESPDRFKQYTRVTLTVNDATEAQCLTTGNAALMKFDVVAASPRSLSAFLHLCKQADIDIISLDFSHRMAFHIDQKHVATAVKRGILFEITYSPVIQGSATRRQVMESTSLVVEYMRGKHFILSSDVDSHAHLRGPYDVMNIGCVVGLPEEQARRAMCENCGLVLQHAYSRKLRYTSVEILSRDEFKAKWSFYDGLVGPPVVTSEISVQDTGDGEDSADECSHSSNDSLCAGLSEFQKADKSTAIAIEDSDSNDDAEVLVESNDRGSCDGSEGDNAPEDTSLITTMETNEDFVKFDSTPIPKKKYAASKDDAAAVARLKKSQEMRGSEMGLIKKKQKSPSAHQPPMKKFKDNNY